MRASHYASLCNMYLSAPLHSFYNTLEIDIQHGRADIKLITDEKYFHAGGSMQGSVIFKLLDDAAFFAAQSLVEDVFVLTYNFNIHFVRPVTQGKLIATGTVKVAAANAIVAEAKLFNEAGKEVAFGTGDFMKSKLLLNEIKGYKVSQ